MNHSFGLCIFAPSQRCAYFVTFYIIGSLFAPSYSVNMPHQLFVYIRAGKKKDSSLSISASSSSSSSCSSEERRKRHRKKRDRKRRRLKEKKRYERSSSTSTSSSSSSEERRKRRKKRIAKNRQRMEEKKLERKKVSGKFWLVDIVHHFAINLSLYILLQSICHFRTQTNTSYYILFLQGKRMRLFH